MSAARRERKTTRDVALAMFLELVFATPSAGAAPPVSKPSGASVDACLKSAEQSQPLRAQGKLIEARTELIACSSASCPAAIRTDCTQWLAEVERALPTIIVRARDEHGDRSDVRVSIDGVSAATRLDGLPIPLNPGEHALHFEAPGTKPVDQKVVIEQSSRDRVITVTFASPDGRNQSSRTVEPRPVAARPPLVSWILGGAGVLAIGGGSALWVIGSSAHDDLESTCAVTSSCAHADVVSARTKLIAGDVLVGAGVIALGVAIVLAVVGSADERAPIKARASYGGR